MRYTRLSCLIPNELVKPNVLNGYIEFYSKHHRVLLDKTLASLLDFGNFKTNLYLNHKGFYRIDEASPNGFTLQTISETKTNGRPDLLEFVDSVICSPNVMIVYNKLTSSNPTEYFHQTFKDMEKKDKTILL